MNTLVKAIVLSISTALVAAPAMAAPQDHANNRAPMEQNHKQPVNNSKHDYNKPPAKAPHQQVSKYDQGPKHYAKKRVDPSRDWRVGQKLPGEYRGHTYKVDHKKYKRLQKPTKNQQWIKVNGDYVLTNVMNHTILKIIAG